MRTLLLLSVLAAPAVAQQPNPANATPPRPATPLLGRPSPPQPTQARGLDYFMGTWSFSWTDRESPLTQGPRTGAVTFARTGATLTATTTGQVEGAGGFKESATLEWDESAKMLSIRERLASGVELSSTGDWSTAIAIRVDSAPVTVQGQSLRLRRTYSIISAQSFTVAEELSTNGGAFVRLGGGTFKKTP